MKRLIRFVAGLYPRSWQERYGAEFAALLEDVNPDWRTSLDILKSALEMQMKTSNFGKILLAAGIAGAFVAAGVSFAIPKQYASQTVLKVAAKEDRSDTGAAVLSLAQQTLSQNSLLSVINLERLYRQERARMPIGDVLDTMRKSIRITAIAQSAFAIQYTHDDPYKAQRVTQDLAASFIRENELGSAKVDLQILDAASLPQRPVSASRWRITVVGFAAGLILAAIVALLRISNSARILAIAGPAGALVAFAISFAIPSQYVSSAVLRIVPGNQTASDDIAALVREAERPEWLAHVVNDFGLYDREKLPVEEAVAALKKSIEIKPIQAVSGQTVALAIRFEYSDRNKAQRVTERLVSKLVEGSTLQVLDSASLPMHPSFPNRPTISLTGVLAGLCMGAILAFRLRASRRTA